MELSRRQKTIVAGVLIFLIFFLAHFVLLTKYRLSDVDDAWNASRIYTLITEGYSRSAVFYPEVAAENDRYLWGKSFLGESVVTLLGWEKAKNAYFGLGRAYINGKILSIIGWTKKNLHLISFFFLLTAAFLWYKITQALKLDKTLCLVSTLALTIMPAFFWLSHLGRPETLVVTICFLSFFLFLKKRYLLSGFFMLVGAEMHIMGGMAAFYILAYTIYDWRNHYGGLKKLLRWVPFFMVGAVGGILYYYALHHADLTSHFLSDILSKRSGAGGGSSKFAINYLFTYFGSREFYLHIPEFLFFAYSIFLFYKKKLFREYRFLNILFIVLLVSTVVVGKSNRRYIVYMYPVLLLLSFAAMYKLGKLKKALIVLGVYLFAIYSFSYIKNCDFSFQTVTNKTSQALKDPALPVVGMSDNWFAAVGRKFYPIHDEIVDVRKRGFKELYLIQNDYLSRHTKIYYPVMDYFKTNYLCRLVASFRAYGSRKVKIFRCTLRKQRPSR